MAQLSRPYQIGLLAVALLAAAWLLLIQGHSSNSSSSGSPTPVVSSSSSPSTSAPSTATASTGTHPGSTSGPTAPGVAGLTRAIAKAQGAVKTSETNASQLQHNSEAASSPTGTSAQPSASTTTSSSAAPTSPAATPTKHSTAPAKHAAATKTAPSTAKTVPSTAKTVPSTAKTAPSKAAPGAATRTTADQRQLSVESELHKGKIVVILFWNRNGTDDRAVHAAVEGLSHSGLGIAVETASAGEVASFGSITRGVQVYGTPTTLIVNGKGKAKTLTGLQDPYGIMQAIQEARNA